MLMQNFAVMLSVLFKVFTLWFLATGLLFWKKPAPYARRAPKTRFACLIPARNEEAVIAALVESLRAQRYPGALYDIYVIPNNCTDATEDRAREAGAKIFRCFDPVCCKGDALHEAVSWLLPRGYDAFCLFDADNIADPDFLARMNDAFLSGARVAKARLRVKNPLDSWVSGCYALYFACNDTFFSRSRANWGLSAKLVGTGMAVHREVLVRMGGWNTETIAEDAEFSAQCAVLGERVWWVPDAVTYDEAPTSLRVSLTQRRRWCSGIMSTAERMVPRLLRAKAARVRAADACLFLCAPFAQAFSVVPALLFALAAAAQGTLAAWGAGTLLSLAAAYGGSVLLAAALRFPAGQRVRVSSTLLFPLFMASFLPLQIVSLLRRTTGWQPIAHTRGFDAALTGQSVQENVFELGKIA
ncbi:MAG: glycosyltransferase [Ruminococcaceae bacterium]|nr:glycosyltransferase [Oscillospiraceae bacterium]